jgi:hypothetical protein
MPLFKRPDGAPVRNMHHFNRMLPYLMPTRTESAIYLSQEFDVTDTIAFIRRYNKDPSRGEEQTLTLFYVMLCAFARTIALRPRMNRFISGYRYYQRNEISFNFVAKKNLSDEGEEINVKLRLSPRETLGTIAPKLRRAIRGSVAQGNDGDRLNRFIMSLPRPLIRLFVSAYRGLDYANLLPDSMIESDPFFSTIFFTNLGSVGMDAPIHHNFELGTCGIFVALGKLRKVWRFDDAGKQRRRDVVELTFSYDDRISDGIYAGKSIDLVRSFVENPEPLLAPPEFTAEQIGAMGITRE